MSPLVVNRFFECQMKRFMFVNLFAFVNLFKIVTWFACNRFDECMNLFLTMGSQFWTFL